MKRQPQVHRNPWALVVLGLLREQPMHPYEMQRRIRERGKDKSLDLKPGSLYHAITRLEAAQLIEAVETAREGRRPERTVYRLTQDGEDVLVGWLQDMLSRPSRDASDLIAAITHLPHLQPEEAARCLQVRAALLEAEIAGMESLLRTLTPQIGRVVLLEEDLALALKRAERDWVCRLIDDLRSGVYHWDTEELMRNPGTVPGLRSGPTEEEAPA